MARATANRTTACAWTLAALLAALPFGCGDPEPVPPDPGDQAGQASIGKQSSIGKQEQAAQEGVDYLCGSWDYEAGPLGGLCTQVSYEERLAACAPVCTSYNCFMHTACTVPAASVVDCNGFYVKCRCSCWSW